MPRLSGRVQKLEQAAGVDSEYCQCHSREPIHLVWRRDEDEQETEPEVCPKCGKPVKTIVLAWADDRGGDADPTV